MDHLAIADTSPSLPQPVALNLHLLLNAIAYTMNGHRLPDLSRLKIHYNFHSTTTPHHVLPDDIAHPDGDPDPAMDRLRTYVKSLPYPVESYAHMQELLDFILTRLVQCVRAKDFDPGFLQWDSMLN